VIQLVSLIIAAYNITGHPYSKIVGALARPLPRLILILRIRWAPSPSIVTSHGMFNLNDIGSVIEMNVRQVSGKKSPSMGSSMRLHTLDHPESGYSMALESQVSIHCDDRKKFAKAQ
jgi:hypothetical protein